MPRFSDISSEMSGSEKAPITLRGLAAQAAKGRIESDGPDFDQATKAQSELLKGIAKAKSRQAGVDLNDNIIDPSAEYDPIDIELMDDLLARSPQLVIGAVQKYIGKGEGSDY